MQVFLIQLSNDGHLNSFRILCIMNSAALKQMVSLSYNVFISSEIANLQQFYCDLIIFILFKLFLKVYLLASQIYRDKE